ncbi:MAG: hypothetical protein IPF68_20390 [Bacteroidales bacterium]|nr:hypothetical protein [Bacteroidales bacterium]
MTVTQDITTPVAVITGNQELTCTLTSITLSAASSTGQGTLSYLWSTGATTVSINVNAPSDYSVTVTDSDNGCTDTELVTVTGYHYSCCSNRQSGTYLHVNLNYPQRCIFYRTGNPELSLEHWCHNRIN